jgi:hypothetical protein
VRRRKWSHDLDPMQASQLKEIFVRAKRQPPEHRLTAKDGKVLAELGNLKMYFLSLITPQGDIEGAVHAFKHYLYTTERSASSQDPTQEAEKTTPRHVMRSSALGEFAQHVLELKGKVNRTNNGMLSSKSRIIAQLSEQQRYNIIHGKHSEEMEELAVELSKRGYRQRNAK